MSQNPDPLGRYRKKRDFSQTPEPRGGEPSAPSPLTFVVQRHAARRLHYDFRLEWNGVLKSWAVTKGPSLDPADKRLAVEVEDHPLGYASFEGTIPKPDYGGGTVQVWDRGTWSPSHPDRVEQDLAEGGLKFALEGSRLRGGFMLVRMHPRPGDKRERCNWLLIKERDAAATPGAGDEVLKAATSVISGRTLEEIGEDRPPKPEGTRLRAPSRKGRTKSAAVGEGERDALTHPDRVLWPATERTQTVTKRDLAHYYALYAKLLLTQIVGRPLAVLRAPEGIAGKPFFQRHALAGRLSPVATVRIPGQSRPFLCVEDEAGLLGLAQMSVVELHPWGAHAASPDIPDWLVFDLDPGEGVPFDQVIRGALEVRERLRALGLVSYPKATGGKGMHVVVPVAPVSPLKPVGWEEAREFAKTICSQMEHDSPRFYTTAVAKRARTGRIFLDYLRNDYLASAVAAWSPRGRDGAPLARPLAWTDVAPGLEAVSWRLPDLLGEKPKVDPWAGMDEGVNDLRRAIERAAFSHQRHPLS